MTCKHRDFRWKCTAHAAAASAAPTECPNADTDCQMVADFETEIAKLKLTIHKFRAAVDELCDCGGSSPSDPACCLACRIYHAAGLQVEL